MKKVDDRWPRCRKSYPRFAETSSKEANQENRRHHEPRPPCSRLKTNYPRRRQTRDLCCMHSMLHNPTTVNTDVLVLAVFRVQDLSVDEIWIAFGTGKHFRYLPVHSITATKKQGSLHVPVSHWLRDCIFHFRKG